MSEILSEILSIRFLVITVAIGMVLTIAGNLLTPFVAGRMKAAALWFREYGDFIIFPMIVGGMILGVGISASIHYKLIDDSFRPLARIGFLLWGED